MDADSDDASGGADDLPGFTFTTGSEDDAGDEEDSGAADDKPDVEPVPTSCSAESPCPLDILVVVDNSGTMLDAQTWLARALAQQVQMLQFDPSFVHLDVQVMFTTTDVGNPTCEPFEPSGYDPAMGGPVSTGCNARIDAFTALGADPVTRAELCTDVCPIDVAPDDPFVAFTHLGGDNVPDVPDRDVDGDGYADSPVAQAVACLAPQGLNGCGYESPLSAMLRALDPDAPWNSGERPFLRPDSVVLVIIATDETDCSLDDPSLMDDAQYWEVNPDTGQPQLSSALCWNAGVSCERPDANGVYGPCNTDGGVLAPTAVATDRLVGELRGLEGRDVAMIAVTGVPPVTAGNPSPPFEPVAGGVHDLVIREWRDGVVPEGDVFPGEVADGIQASDLAFEFGIGPGCAYVDEATGLGQRGIPNPRVNDVCRALDLDAGVRCCIESVCDPDLRLDCLSGWSVDLGFGPPFPD